MTLLTVFSRSQPPSQTCGNFRKAVDLNETVCAGYSKKGGVAFALIIKELCFKNVLLAMCASAAEGKVRAPVCVRADTGTMSAQWHFLL
jgi:hypothetical protein